MAEHTPGPWTYAPTPCASREGTRIVYRVRSDHPFCGYFVAVCDDYHADSENEPNARLIAAAPDLLAACEAMLKAQESDTDDRAVDLAIDAVNKARGVTL